MTVAATGTAATCASWHDPDMFSNHIARENPQPRPGTNHDFVNDSPPSGHEHPY
jgi:hypothetical protein